ncbi:hypothetical protein R6Q59_029943 [Mikania micrantha]
MADMAGVFRNTIGLQDNSNDIDEYNYDEDDRHLQVNVGENDGGENDTFEDARFEDASIEDAGGKDDSSKDDGGKRPRITRSDVGAFIGVQSLYYNKILMEIGPHLQGSHITQWRWDVRDDQYIFEGFVNVLRDRFPDIMSEFREKSRNKAREDGHDIPFGEEKFDIIVIIHPIAFLLRDGNIWNTDKWLKRSKTGRSNCNNDLSRHTGGSMGFDEHRIKLDKQKGKKVGYELVFIDTHATKDTKKRLREGEININDLDELEFVTSRSKESFEVFHKELVKEYGSDNDENLDRDEFAVWERLHPNVGGRMFGVGSSDPRFVVTGSQSSYDGSNSYGDALQSQNVKDVESQLQKEMEARQSLENRLEQMERVAEKERAE